MNMIRRRKSSCPDASDHHHSHNSRRASSAASNLGGRDHGAPPQKGVKLDLYIDDDDLMPSSSHHNSNSPYHRKSPSHSNHSSPGHRRQSSVIGPGGGGAHGNIEELAEEVLCLRLLSTRTRYRFGGLQIHIISPVFSMDKMFNVEFDQDSQVSLIKSQQSKLEADQKKRAKENGIFSALDPKLVNGGKAATIVVSDNLDDYSDNENEDGQAKVNDLSTVVTEMILYEGRKLGGCLNS